MTRMFENFFDFNVPLATWIASQVIGAIGIGIAMWSFQVKRKIKLFFIIGCANVLMAVSVALLLNWVVFALLCIAVARNLAFAYLEKRKEQGKNIAKGVPFVLMICFIIANIIAVAFTWVWWFDFVLLTASCVVIFGSWLKTTHVFRVSCLSYDSLAVVNYIKFSNVIGLVQSVLLVGAVITFYIRLFIEKRKRVKFFALTET